MKIWILIIFFLINLFCFGQSKTLVTFINKKDTLKKHSAPLPLKAGITTFNGNWYDAVIINANDSIVKALKYRFDFTKPLADSENAILNKEAEEIKMIKHNKKLSSKEKEQKYLEVDMTNYRDTISLKTSSIEKIRFWKPKPSKLAKTACITIYCICGLVLIAGVVGGASDTINKRERPIYSLIAIGGLGGAVACLFWLSHILHENIYVKEWYIRTYHS